MSVIRVSSLVGALRERLSLDLPTVLDLGCGYGRHALWLAEHGCIVTALDIDARRIAALHAAMRSQATGRINCVVGDGTKPLPFAANSFDAVLVVEFVPRDLSEVVAPVIREGGYLAIETFSGRGGNWLDLPRAGQFRDEFDAQFEVLGYRERGVGPTRTEAVTVTMLARKGQTRSVGQSRVGAAPDA